MTPQTILVIDDEPGVRISLEMILDPVYHVLLANSADEGLEVITNTEKIDLVLMDLRMPGMDALTAIETMKRLRPEVPIMIMTAGRTESVQKKIADRGWGECIKKPFEIEDLHERIKRAIEEKIDPAYTLSTAILLEEEETMKLLAQTPWTMLELNHPSCEKEPLS